MTLIQNNQRKHNVRPLKTDVSEFTVNEPSELLAFLLATLSNLSRKSVKSILTRGQVYVNGKSITQHNHPLKAGQTVSIMDTNVLKKKSALEGISILHEDDDIIVIEKDSGILSIATNNSAERTAYRQLSDYVKEGNRHQRIFIVHRLDRDTSGVMLFAKSEEIKNALQKNWHTVVKERIYNALVEGNVRDKEGTISSWLTESKTMKVYSNNYDNGGKHAVTHYKKRQGNANYSLLEVQLETGRKNQIRVHMEEIGHPVAGDKKYGARTNPLRRLGLHASTLALVHPTTSKLMRFTSKVPRSFLKNSK